MSSEGLAALGIYLRDEYHTWLAALSGGWLNDALPADGNWRALGLVNDDLLALVRPMQELADLEQRLNAGYPAAPGFLESPANPAEPPQDQLAWAPPVAAALQPARFEQGEPPAGRATWPLDASASPGEAPRPARERIPQPDRAAVAAPEAAQQPDPAPAIEAAAAGALSGLGMSGLRGLARALQSAPYIADAEAEAAGGAHESRAELADTPAAARVNSLRPVAPGRVAPMLPGLAAGEPGLEAAAIGLDDGAAGFGRWDTGAARAAAAADGHPDAWPTLGLGAAQASRAQPAASRRIEPEVEPPRGAADPADPPGVGGLRAGDLTRLYRELATLAAWPAAAGPPAADEAHAPQRAAPGASGAAGAIPAPALEPAAAADAPRWQRLLAALPLAARGLDLALPVGGAAGPAEIAAGAVEPRAAHLDGQQHPGTSKPIDSARSAPERHAPPPEPIDLREIIDALAQEIGREYRRFYGP